MGSRIKEKKIGGFWEEEWGYRESEIRRDRERQREIKRDRQRERQRERNRQKER